MIGYVREQLTIAGVKDSSIVNRVLERLQNLRECDSVSIGNERYVAPGESRWVPTGEGKGVFLSVAAPPGCIRRAEPGSPFDLAQRIHIESDADLAELQLAGAREISIGEWLTPLHYIRHVARRRRRPVRSDEVDLRGFWEILTADLADDGLRLGEDAEVRVVTGMPGDYFGRYSAPGIEGRWSVEPPDGVWCGYRRGYSGNHWHPAIIEVDNNVKRALDLFDHDEWRWALLARGRSLGEEELMVSSDGVMRLKFPAPGQIRTLLDLIGARSGRWTWGWPNGSVNPWTFIP